MSVLQIAVAALCIALLGGGLYLCYIVIQINDADREAERRRMGK